ncbi:MAG: hypothetical protein ACHP9S_05985 [Terriglobales bacterium]|jgi:hypothetical protein
MACNQWFRRIGQAALLGALLLGVVPAQADRDDKCRQRIRKAEAQLDSAVRKHGRNSRQAEKRRQELDRVRDQCGRHDKH